MESFRFSNVILTKSITTNKNFYEYSTIYLPSIPDHFYTFNAMNDFRYWIEIKKMEIIPGTE